MDPLLLTCISGLGLFFGTASLFFGYVVFFTKSATPRTRLLLVVSLIFWAMCDALLGNIFFAIFDLGAAAYIFLTTPSETQS